MKKTEIRDLFKQKRRMLEPDQVTVYQRQLEEQFGQLKISSLSMVHAYMPLEHNHEPDPLPIVHALLHRFIDLRWCAPVTIPDSGTMTHRQVDATTVFSTNRWGIREPIEGLLVDPTRIDLSFIPLLAVDQHGHRVGYGKGFYDRFLSIARPDMIKIGLSFFSPIEAITDIDFFDKKLDFCITPERVYAF